jgi:putative oxidoreductase
MNGNTLTMHVTSPLTERAPWLGILGSAPSGLQTILRLTLAAVMLPHAGQHAFGLFGGYGFTKTVQWMTGTLGFPSLLAATAIVVETVAPIALIAGLGSRAAGLLLAVLMATAATTHAANGFFMNWTGALPAGSEGFECHQLAIALALTVAVRGGGSFSVDRLWSGTVAREGNAAGGAA